MWKRAALELTTEVYEAISQAGNELGEGMSETFGYEPKSKDGRTPCYVCGDLVRLLERRQEAEARHRELRTTWCIVGS